MRKNIAKLARRVTDDVRITLGQIPMDENRPEYVLYDTLLDDEQCELMLHMKRREPVTVPELAKKLRWDEGRVQRILDGLADIGVVEYNWHNAKHEKQYVIPVFVVGSAENLMLNDKLIAKYPELIGKFQERMSYLPLEPISHMVPPGGAGMGFHVIPVESAIPKDSQSLDIEHVSHWLDKYRGHIATGACVCRRSMRLQGKGCGELEDDVCVYLGDYADYLVQTGKGVHYISYEEAVELMQRTEANGYMHQVTNGDGPDDIFAICNCTLGSCFGLRCSQLFNNPNMSASAYRAKVDPSKCVACGKCVEYCPAGAVKLGQKLCDKHGNTVEYPKHELPHGLKWGEEHWDPDYRDNNRKNCYDKGTAPCKTACPAHVAVQGYLKLAAQGKYQEALALIKKDNPFPAVCGRICNKRCEEACTRGTIDQAVAIDAVKKFLAEQDLHAETRYIPPVVVASSRLTGWDQKIAIIGAGPAGLSAAYYLATRGYKPTVFEKSARPGGMMTYGIPSFKLEKTVIDAEIQVLRELGVEIRCGVEVGKDVTIPQLREQGYLAFYVAIGCQGGRLPGVPGETAKGTDIAVHFLHEALADETQRMEGSVVVVGGGNVAIDCARTAVRFGAEKVSMVCLESRETMPAAKDEIAEAEEEHVEICAGWGPQELLQDESGHVTAVVFKKCLRTIDPETGRFSPAYDESETITIPADHVVFAIGQAIEWGSLLQDTKVEFHRGNYPVADPLTYQTAEEDIFVGGDVYHGPKFVIDAIEEGKCAAESLHRYVHKGADLKIGRNRRDFIMLDKENFSVNCYDHAARQTEAVDPAVDPHSFRDARRTLTPEQVQTETARCLGCGASWVDPNKCIGCGVCTTKCVFDAIHLKRDHPECSTMMKAEDKLKGIASMTGKRLGETLRGRKD